MPARPSSAVKRCAIASTDSASSSSPTPVMPRTWNNPPASTPESAPSCSSDSPSNIQHRALRGARLPIGLRHRPVVVTCCHRRATTRRRFSASRVGETSALPRAVRPWQDHRPGVRLRVRRPEGGLDLTMRDDCLPRRRPARLGQISPDVRAEDRLRRLAGCDHQLPSQDGLGDAHDSRQMVASSSPPMEGGP